MSHESELPAGAELVRTTDVFDEHRHPKGLLRAHRVAEHVWARLVVHTGELGFVFEDDDEDRDGDDDRDRAGRRIGAGEGVVIPPQRLHHVELDRPVTFSIEFHRESSSVTPEPGDESTGLASD